MLGSFHHIFILVVEKENVPSVPGFPKGMLEKHLKAVLRKLYALSSQP